MANGNRLLGGLFSITAGGAASVAVTLSLGLLMITVLRPVSAWRSFHRSRPWWSLKAWATVGPIATAAGTLRTTVTPSGTHMPKVVHRVLREGDVKPRVIVVGDVHGCLDELKLLLQKAGYHQAKDSVVLVGDLVNKGPFSPEVVRYARDNVFLSVRGNHDDSALAAYHGVGKFSSGAAPSYDYVKTLAQEDLNWLENLPYTITLPPSFNAIVVHAGLLPGVTLEGQTAQDMSRMRNVEVTEDGSILALEKAKTGKPWVELYEGPQHVYFGHDAKRGLQRGRFATGLDTGCCYGRELTAVLLPSREIISVKAARPYVEGKDK